MDFHPHALVRILPEQLHTFERVLKHEGFWNAGLFQFWKQGQLYGYVKSLGNDLEWHVRAFRNGWLGSEIEPSRWTRNHFTYPPVTYFEPLIGLLRRYGFLHPSAFWGWNPTPTKLDSAEWLRRPQRLP